MAFAGFFLFGCGLEKDLSGSLAGGKSIGKTMRRARIFEFCIVPLCAASVTCGTLYSAPAQGTPISFAYEATVTEVLNIPGAEVGIEMNGNFSNGTSLTDAASSATFGQYDVSGAVGVRLTANHASLAFGFQTTFLQIIDGGGFDQFTLAAFPTAFEGLSIGLLDLSGDVFLTDAIPLSLSLDEYGGERLIELITTGGRGRIVGEITSLLPLSTVPVPPAILLFFSSLVGLAGFAHWRRLEHRAL